MRAIPFSNLKVYVFEAEQLNRIERVMNRLYSEERFKNGDEMRDCAQVIQSVLDGSVPFDYDE